MTVLLLEQIAHTQVEESAMGFEVAFSGEVEKAKIVTHIEAELVVQLYAGSKSPVEVEGLTALSELVALVEQVVSGTVTVIYLVREGELERGTRLAKNLEVVV